MLHYPREHRGKDMNTIMIGNSEYSILLSEYLEDEGVHVDAYAVEEDFKRESPVGSSIQVISLREMFERYEPESTRLFMGIGYKMRGEIRKKLFEICSKNGFHFSNYIHPSAKIDRSIQLGEGNIIFENVVIQKHVKVGNCNLFFSNAVVMHDDTIGNYNTCCACSVMNGFVKMEDNVFLGSNATIRDHVKIETGTIIGAGVYVNRNSEKDMAVIGRRPTEIMGRYKTTEKIIKLNICGMVRQNTTIPCVGFIEKREVV